MLKTPPICYLLLLLTTFSAGGASCRNLTRQQEPLAPVVFTGPPTLEDIMGVVNTNSARVRQLYSNDASVSTTGFGSLSASLWLERPRRFRLRAKLFSPELDLGSNDSLFWFWAKGDPQQATYYAYHEQFVAQAANQGLPIGPDWLIESLGLIQLDPAGRHDGPTARPDQKIEIRTHFERNGALYTRLLVIDEKHGWIVEQQIIDAAGRTLATARTSNHRLYEGPGVTLPHRVQIELPSAQLAFQIEVGQYLVNQLNGDPSQLFEIQNHGGKFVNIGLTAPPITPLPAGGLPAGGQPPSGPYPSSSPSFYEPRTSHRPQYRGVR